MSAQPVIASGAVVTATSQSASVTVPSVAVDTVGVLVRATAVSGTSPSLTVSLQWSYDGTNFVAADPADSFTAITAAGGAAKAFTIKAPYFRLNYAVSGTSPSFTLTCTANFA